MLFYFLNPPHCCWWGRILFINLHNFLVIYMKLFQRIFDKFHKVRFGEVYSYFKSNGMMENLRKMPQFKYSVTRLETVLRSNPQMLDTPVFDKALIIEGVIGAKTKSLMKNMIRTYYQHKGLEDNRLLQIDLWM